MAIKYHLKKLHIKFRTQTILTNPRQTHKLFITVFLTCLKTALYHNDHYVRFLSPIFTVPKPNGKHRLLNYFIDVEHFMMEDYRTVLKIQDSNHFMTRLDLKDTYFLIYGMNMIERC